MFRNIFYIIFLFIGCVNGSPDHHEIVSKDSAPYYEVKGSGPITMIMIHGWGCDHRVFQEQVIALEKQVKLILVDLPGHGRSFRAKDYSYQSLANAVRQVLIETESKKVIVVGYSNGVPVGRELIRQVPELVSGFIAIDGPLRQPNNKMPEAMQKKFMHQLKTKEMKTLVEGLLPQTLPLEESILSRLRSMMLGTDRAALVGTLEASKDSKFWKNDKISVPVLSFVTEHSEQMMYGKGYEDYLKSIASNLAYIKLKDANHFSIMTDPIMITTPILKWLESQFEN